MSEISAVNVSDESHRVETAHNGDLAWYDIKKHFLVFFLPKADQT